MKFDISVWLTRSIRSIFFSLFFLSGPLYAEGSEATEIDGEAYLISQMIDAYTVDPYDFQDKVCATDPRNSICPRGRQTTTCGSGCSEPSNVKYYVSNVAIDPTRSQGRITGEERLLTDRVLGNRVEIIRNCSPDVLQLTRTVSFNIVEGVTVLNGTSFSKVSGSNINLTLGPKAISSLPSTIVASQSTSVTEGSTFSRTQQDTRTDNVSVVINRPVGPGEVLYLDVRQFGIVVSGLYTGSVVLDGEFRAASDDKYDDTYLEGRLSDFLSEEQRTVGISGEVLVFDRAGQGTDDRYLVVGFDDDMDACFNSSADEVRNFALNPKFLKVQAGPLGIPRVSPLLNGMTITTADTVGTVQVRARSLGGACIVAVTGLGGAVQVDAIPTLWSDWITLRTHTESVTGTVTFSTLCNGLAAPVLTEIQFLAPP